MKRIEDTNQNSAKTMRRNNIWNRLFHKGEIQENIEYLYINLKMVSEKQNFLDKIEKCDSLIKLINIHKDMWQIGFKNPNLAPCSYGIFRTKDILQMTPEEVYLGGVYGLNTYPISYWEDYKEDTYGYNGFGINPNYSLYQMILNQYKGLLKSNIESLSISAKNNIELLNKYGY